MIRVTASSPINVRSHQQLHALSYFIFTSTAWRGKRKIIPILKIRKLRLRNIKQFINAQAPCKQESPSSDLNLDTVISGHTAKFFRNSRTCLLVAVRLSFYQVFTIRGCVQLSLQCECLVFVRGITSVGLFSRLIKIILSSS